ncbi:MAG: CBS domain-containing protein [Candidatus Hydrothermarchaeota archaeon]|jgi:CBS domain-containing protein|nr:CBS domain-containing protein [Candidatus Hydrothermarchaeota archaeon]MDP6612746.1 CBS domain-containing protein [Candidatus Hydrothermarchaeota archaeon]|tara:strand:+ start:89 stop:466 length:378 start_codon:yes stop_codon:yes gene_type:complete
MREIRVKDLIIRDVVTASPEEILALAKLKMMRLGIGGLPVVENRNLVGMITHRDTILAGERAMNLRVQDIMTSKVRAIREDTTLREVVTIMKETGYQRLPVVSRGELVGIVTQSCIINALAEELK